MGKQKNNKFNKFQKGNFKKKPFSKDRSDKFQQGKKFPSFANYIGENADKVEILNVFLLSPPVPQTSIAGL